MDELVNALHNGLGDLDANAATTVHAVPLVWFCRCEGPDGFVSHLVDERECSVCGDERPA